VSPADDETTATTEAEPATGSAASAGKPSAEGERGPVVAFSASIIAALALAGVYIAGGQNQAEGILLAITLGGIGVGLVLWAQRFMPAGPEVEPRGRITSKKEDRAVFLEDWDEGSSTFGRRRFLTKMLFGSFAALGAALVFPIRSLGPAPGRGFDSTAWTSGSRMVRTSGLPVSVQELAVNGVATVFPDGHIGEEDSQVVLIRLRSGEDSSTSEEDGSYEGLVAFSKVCTHAGCPVGLFEEQTGHLLCPCHQSTFDVKDGAKPVFGPATRPLPQLPISADDEGNLIALGDFPDPIGPGYWNQDRQ
jgi:ubiquinol-cytochrome c reductase iron-sulfur subunit